MAVIGEKDLDKFSKDMEDYEQKFLENAEKSKKMYDIIEPVVSNVANYMSTVFNKRLVSPPVGQLRDLSEGVKALSSLSTDTLNSTKAGLEARNKVEDMKLKIHKLKSDEDTNVDNTAIIHNFVEQLRKGSLSDSISQDKPNPAISEMEAGGAELEKRFNEEIGNKIQLSKNDRSMKYDFEKKVNYVYDPKDNKTVALDEKGKKIDDYSEERIPEELRFSRMKDNVPVNAKNKPIPTLKGE